MFNLENFLKLKKYKTIILTAVVLVVIILPLVIVISYGTEIVTELKSYRYIGAGLEFKNTISVTGEGKIYTKPDIAMVSISVVSEGKRVIEVQNENTKKINKVIKFLKDSGIEEKDIKTINYNLSPQYVYEERKTPIIVGYSLSQVLEVKIRILDKVGDILEGATEQGVNEINSLYFKVDKDEEVKEEARKLAIDDAKKKAEKLASQLGVKLVKISSFSEGGGETPVYRNLEYGVGGGGAPQIQVGENEIIISVTLTYEIN